MICKQIVCNIVFKLVRAHFFAHLNGFKYCYLTLMIPFNFIRSFTHS